jgi:hypothetical protein
MQTDYSLYPKAGFPGLLFDLNPTKVDSYANGEASAPLSFGLGVKQGTTDNTILLPTADADELLGITVSSFTYGYNAALTGSLAIMPKDVAAVLKQGKIWVLAEQSNIVPGDPVFWRFTANGAGKAVGQFRKDADTARAVEVAGARWVNRPVAGNGGIYIAVIDLNLP